VVVNHETTTADRWFETSLPAGTYCDVQGNRTVTVNSTGWFEASVAPNTALAIYAGKSSC
jgi:alpha-amylase